MKLFPGIAGGAIAGVIGALTWAGVVYFTNYEIGIIAWGIGALVGLGVVVGSGREGGPTIGVTAAILSLAAIALGKWMWISLVLQSAYDDESMIAEVADIVIEERREAGQRVADLRPMGRDGSLQAMYPPDVWSEAELRWGAYSPQEQERIREAPTLVNPHLHLVFIADDVCREHMDEGRTIDWPTWHDLETAWRKPHYPAEIWSEAERRWEAFSPAEQDQYMQWLFHRQRQAERDWAAAIQPMAFWHSFSLFDGLWALLAVVTAFQIASAREE